MKTILMAFALLLTGCVGLPENVKPVDNFNSDRDLGKWYEIARLDHSFERGLSQVTASYSLRDNTIELMGSASQSFSEAMERSHGIRSS